MKEIMLKKVRAAYVLWLVFAFVLTSCGGSGGSNLTPLYDGGTYLYFNLKGEMAFKTGTDVKEAYEFSDGLALAGVHTDEGLRFGFLDEKGKMVIPAIYVRTTTFSDKMAWVVEPNGAPKAINTRGETVFSLFDAENVMLFSEGVAPFSRMVDDEERFGYVDKKGNVVINPAYILATPFSNGLAAVIDANDKWGYINHKGEMAIAAQFIKGNEFTDGGYAVAATSKDLYGAIDRKGRFVVNPAYEDVKIDGDRFIVKEHGKYGIIDKNEKILIQPEFAAIQPFGDNLYTMASLNGHAFGIIDRKGKFVVNPQFEGGSSFEEGAALVISGGKYGMVDSKGKYIINPSYEGYASNSVRHMIATTDYLDMESIVNAIGSRYRDGAFFGLSASSAFSHAKGLYPDLAAGYYNHTSAADVPLTNNTYINSVALTFSGPTSKREYNYFDRKYETVELNPAVKSAEYEISFNDAKAQRKVSDIVKAVEDDLTARFASSEAQVSVRTSGSSLRIKINY
jgi:hypothetical protein